MTFSGKSNQKKLKRELQKSDPSSFERMAAALISKLLDLPIAVANSGFQYGADAGPAGQQGRRFRIECKKYSDKNKLNERELLGETDQALARDEALEAWMLVATCRVSEQVRQSLSQKGEKIGVPILIIDWPDDNELTPLAALCSLGPDIVESEISEEASSFAEALCSVSKDTIEKLRRNMQSWCLGFETLKTASHKKLEKIWNSPQEANARFGQNIAGGFREKRIRRTSVHEKLTSWWQNSETKEAPAVVVGHEGVGKTWATLDWLIETKNRHPVILTIPSSSAAGITSISETRLKEFLAECLREIAGGIKNSEHWFNRLSRLLKRPIEEGPALIVFFDGLNQEPSINWSQLLKVLQGETFAGRLHVIVSTRKHYFENKLSKLQGLIPKSTLINVDLFNMEPGGELDSMLELEDLKRTDLRPDVIQMARNPRLFNLVVNLRDKLVGPNQITIHRLLWEYGRDSFGVRAGKSFSENEWRDFLKRIARKFRKGVKKFSEKSLGKTVNRPDLKKNEVYARLSDVIDGQFIKGDEIDNLQFDGAIVAHALGTALLNHLNSKSQLTSEILEDKLITWLDPISGLDQQAEILRAAISILVETGNASTSPISGILVTAWLQTQNVPDEHRRELVALAPNFPDALLDAIEHSNSHANSSARNWAVKAVCTIPKSDYETFSLIVHRACSWLRTISLNAPESPLTRVKDEKLQSQLKIAKTENEERRSEHFKQRIGTDKCGSIRVLGTKLELVNYDSGLKQTTIPSIIEGFPLSKAKEIFETAAIVSLIEYQSQSDIWSELRWLCLLNEIDPTETAVTLRKLSKSVRLREPEKGVHPDFPDRVAALLLWLTGQAKDDKAAAHINPDSFKLFTYDKDYLPDPGRSMFPLELRHAKAVLNDKELYLDFRVRRTEELWLDPDFEPPDAFVEEVRVAINDIDPKTLIPQRWATSEIYQFECLEPVLARCAPDLLVNLMKQKLLSMKVCPEELRYWGAIDSINHFMLAGSAEAEAAQNLRLSKKSDDQKEETYISNRLLLIETQNMEAWEQIDALIEADLKYIDRKFINIIYPLKSGDIDELISRYYLGSDKQQYNLLMLLSICQVELSNKAWSWIGNFAMQEGEYQKWAFKILANTDLKKFGQMLISKNWSWHSNKDPWVNNCGTLALIEATSNTDFDKLASRLAPWLLLKATRLRGSKPDEILIATEILNHILALNIDEKPDPDTIISVDRTENKIWPNLFFVEPRLPAEESESLEIIFNSEKRSNISQRAVKIAKSHVLKMHRSGASLYLQEMCSEDIVNVLSCAPNIIEKWLDGMDEPTIEFKRRVSSAGETFLSLCEALLVHDPEHGARLWRALRETLIIRYIGAAKVDDLLHMLFRVPDSPAVIELREELIDLRYCNTDQALFNLSVAASYNGRDDWIDSIIEKDRKSEIAWHQRRAIILTGFKTNNKFPTEDAWPESEIKTVHADLHRKSARQQWIEACARHWWQNFLKASNLPSAYAAWVLFLRSADRRAETWMRQDIKTLGNPKNKFFNLKITHADLNRPSMKRILAKRTNKLDKNFLGRKTNSNVGPWKQ